MRTFPKSLSLGNSALPAWRPITGLHMIRWSQHRIKQLVKFRSPVRTCSLQWMRKARTSGNFLQLGSNQGKGEAVSLAEFFNATTGNWSPEMKQRRNKDTDFALVQGEKPPQLRTLLKVLLFHFCRDFILQDQLLRNTLHKHVRIIPCRIADPFASL